MQKQLEVGASQNTSRTSSHSHNNSNPKHPPAVRILINPTECGGSERPRLLSGSDVSSPSAAQAATADFVGTEFYMDESLPSSLSEHTSDQQHQAIVSYLEVLDRLTPRSANIPTYFERSITTQSFKFCLITIYLFAFLFYSFRSPFFTYETIIMQKTLFSLYL